MFRGHCFLKTAPRFSLDAAERAVGLELEDSWEEEGVGYGLTDERRSISGQRDRTEMLFNTR